MMNDYHHQLFQEKFVRRRVNWDRIALVLKNSLASKKVKKKSIDDDTLSRMKTLEFPQ